MYHAVKVQKTFSRARARRAVSSTTLHML